MNQPIKPAAKRVSPVIRLVSHSLSLITSHYPATPKVKACSPRQAASEGGPLLTVPHWRRAWLLFPLVFCCVALPVEAVTPAPDGHYPGGNTAEGQNSLFKLTTGSRNTATGFDALYHNETGNSNTATGADALFNNTGNSNTATGDSALHNNTSGSNNTATGLNALYSNQIGSANTATGVGALRDNTTGGNNTATGDSALHNNTGGSENTATGRGALSSNMTGYDNTANGYQALYNNTIGAVNTANGINALHSNTDGSFNTANGAFALSNNTDGFYNTANGAFALSNNTHGSDNTAHGYQALGFNTTGHNNIALGFNAGFNLNTGNNNIDIGNVGVAGESDTIRIGAEGTQTNTFIAGISGVAVASGVGVIIDTNGHLGTVVSSERFKDEIKPMDKASEAILALKPVTFRYKRELDPNGIAQFGLVAEQVEKVNPNLVARDTQGKIYTVRYEAVNAMLLNEFLKEHRRMQEQEATIAQLKSTVAQQQKDFQAAAAHQQEQFEALTAGLQRVTTQVEMSRPAPQTVINN
jgi:Chaperone of endosialidase